MRSDESRIPAESNTAAERLRLMIHEEYGGTGALLDSYLADIDAALAAEYSRGWREGFAQSASKRELTDAYDGGRRATVERIRARVLAVMEDSDGIRPVVLAILDAAVGSPGEPTEERDRQPGPGFYDDPNAEGNDR